ncbi:TPA: ABC transporter substrate-binding protein [Pasteurella multocida]|uniref:ABC transporter substrate-binding protein n=1 Tax=Pasteurella multocida TaxID=747 RepID=UPI002879DCEF|nr:ABC transporter substrate-binding protein [Pasteurella multocida]HDX1087450.1 ABC transporter substrate-binding protein [Pasteurella multocida]HED4414362.1 ABC transporter substrate-binding protein [Pasteurella multocida]
MIQRYVKIVSIALLLFLGVINNAFAARVITDQLGRKVTIPDEVNRVVVLQHQTLNLLVQLDAKESVVGVLSSWKKQLGKNYSRFMPELETMPQPGDLTQVNIESLLALKPQLVFVANYAPKEMIEQIEQAGVPVIAISLREDKKGEEGKVNPEMEDEEVAYNNGLKQGIYLIGEVVNRQAQAKKLVTYTFEQRELVSQRLSKVPDEQRVRVYIANPDLATYGSGKYTGLMMLHAGAKNVAAETIKGFKQVSIEQVIHWNPAVILVQERYPQVIEQIKKDPSWQIIDAVKNQRIYLMPEYAKAWGYPMPEALAIGELWLAKQLYPELFADVDLEEKVNQYYKLFYRMPYNQ